MDQHPPIGELVNRGGQWLRHVGGGLYEPVPEPIAKRFAPPVEEMTSGVRRAFIEAKERG